MVQIKKEYILPVLAVLLFFLSLALFAKIFIGNLKTVPVLNEASDKVCFKNNCFVAEIASSPGQLERGLMYRKSLPADRGMLFVFDKESIYPFWMKNTLIPLDMIWMNEAKRVVFIKENAMPCRQIICPLIEPGQKAKYVLELNGGESKKINLKLGDSVVFN